MSSVRNHDTKVTRRQRPDAETAEKKWLVFEDQFRLNDDTQLLNPFLSFLALLQSDGMAHSRINWVALKGKLRSWIGGSWKETTTAPANNLYEVVQNEDRDVIRNTDLDVESSDNSSAGPKISTFEIETVDNGQSSWLKWKAFLMAWVSIILALIAGGSIGPAFKYMSQHGIRACLSASWRCQCMLPFLLPLAMIEYYTKKDKRVAWFGRKPDLKYPVIVHIIFSGLAWAGNLLSWIVGLQYTTTFKASLIACSHPLMLALWLLIRGDKVPALSLIGVVVAFSGLLLSNLPDLLHEDPNGPHFTWQEQALGIFLCFSAAAFEVVVLFNRIVTQKYVPLMQYTFATTIVVAICATLAAILLEGTGLIHSPVLVDAEGHVIPRTVEVFCIADNCIFGYMAHKWLWKVLTFGLIVGVVCIAGFNYAMQYLPPMVFSSTALLDPALTAILSWICGIEALPTLYSWLGGGTVICGVALISIAEAQHKKEHEKSAAHSKASADHSGTASLSSDNANDTEFDLDDDIEESSRHPLSRDNYRQKHEPSTNTASYSQLPPPLLDSKPSNKLFSVVSPDDEDEEADDLSDSGPVLNSPPRLQAKDPTWSTHQTIAPAFSSKQPDSADKDVVISPLSTAMYPSGKGFAEVKETAAH